MQFEDILSLLEADLHGVETRLAGCLDGTISRIQEISKHLILSGGKRIRPVITLLSAHALSYKGQAHIEAAVIIELIHSATLLHDDVVDGSEQRRQQSTSHLLWGNAATILSGDYLYSRAFQMMTRLEKATEILRLLADATTVIAEGEMKQLLNRHNPCLSETTYFEIITGKTAKLFEVCAAMGGLLAQASDAQIQALSSYGLNVGLAFQLVDDALDYSHDSDQIGKNVGDDLAEGKATLPLIYAMEKGDEKTRSLISESLKNGDRSRLPEIREAILALDAVEHTKAAAQHCIDLALNALDQLPSSPYREALAQVAHFSASRLY